MKNRVISLVRQKWQHYLVYGVSLAAAVAVLLYKLYELVPYPSRSEVAARAAAQTYQQLLDDPLFLPHKAMQLLAYVAGLDSLLTSRVISTFFAFIAVLFFYRVIRTWYTPRVAFMGSSVFLTASWFLHTARMATPTVLYLLSIALIWAGLRIAQATKRPITIALIAAVMLVLLYVPGFIWLLMAACIWQRKRITAAVRSIRPVPLSILGLGGLISLAVLVQAFIRDPSLILTWLGLPSAFMAKEAAIDLILTPYHIFVRAPFNPEVWLGRLPYSNIAMTLLFGLGCFVLYKSVALDRIRALIGFSIIGALLAALGGAVSLVIVLPLLCVAVTAGLALLLQQWFTVFPRNPIARAVGVLCVSALVALSAAYNLYQYFEVWPRNPDVQRVYSSQKRS